MLIVGVTLWFISDFIIPFKSSILNTSDYQTSGWKTWVAFEYLYPLLAIYGVLIIYLCVLLGYTWKWKTGLRWNPVSIADNLALFRHSDFLEDFKDLDMDDPACHRERFADSAYRLGYWRIDKNGPPQYWHGFGRDRRFLILRSTLLKKLTIIQLEFQTDLNQEQSKNPQLIL